MALTRAVAALIPTVFQMELMKPEPGISFLQSAGMVGAGFSYPVKQLTNLERMPGETVTCRLLAPLKGAGVASNQDASVGPFTSSGNKLTGQEEEMVYSTSAATVAVMRNAVKVLGEQTVQRQVAEIMTESIPSLRQWIRDVQDKAFFTAVKFSGVYDVTGGMAVSPQGVVVLSGEQPTWAGVTAAQKMSVSRIRKIAYLCRLRRIRKVNMPGVGLIRGVLAVTPGQAFDLQDGDPDWQDILRQAGPRSLSENPLFTGAFGGPGVNIDGIYIHVQESTAITGTTNGSLLRQDTTDPNFDKAEAIFFGGNAALEAEVYDMKMIEGEVTDYGDQPSVGAKTFKGYAKTTFNDGTIDTPAVRDYGILYVPTSAPKAA